MTALALSCAAGPAFATNFTALTQPFDVSYVQHASTGSQEFEKYNGPLKIYDVTVNWTADSYAGYLLQGAPTGLPHFDQPYSGAAGFRIFDLENIVGQAQVAFSGVGDCTQIYCLIGGTTSGTTHLDPLDFRGIRRPVIDFWGSITPDINCCGEEAIGGSGVRGTIVYLLGPVPEPGSWAMMAVGFGAIGGAIRSKRKAAMSIRFD
jgi:hypothetical protein